ncbi:hypothetical protein MT391_11100 [Vibrio sp. 1-Bac 57]
MTNYNTRKNRRKKNKNLNSSEKRPNVIRASALTWSIRRANSANNYLSCRDTYYEYLHKFLNKRGIRHNTDIEFLKWDKNQAVQQKAQLFHLTMHLNIIKEGSDDFVFPFSLWPLRSNKSFFLASDNKLSEKFNKSLNDALMGLKIEPEYYYVITGESNPNDKKNCRHIHGCIRLPASFYDPQNFTAVKAIYDILKRACGLTETREKQINKSDKRTSEYRFAIAAINKNRPDLNKPYGHMLNIGEPLTDHWSQEHWSEYIICDRNTPNNIHRTKKLAVDAVCINDNLYAEYERLRSCSDWCDNSPRFDLITKAWAEVIRDYVKPTESKDEVTADTNPKPTERKAKPSYTYIIQ